MYRHFICMCQFCCTGHILYCVPAVMHKTRKNAQHMPKFRTVTHHRLNPGDCRHTKQVTMHFIYTDLAIHYTLWSLSFIVWLIKQNYRPNKSLLHPPNSNEAGFARVKVYSRLCCQCSSLSNIFRKKVKDRSKTHLACFSVSISQQLTAIWDCIGRYTELVCC